MVETIYSCLHINYVQMLIVPYTNRLRNVFSNINGLILSGELTFDFRLSPLHPTHRFKRKLKRTVSINARIGYIYLVLCADYN